MRKSQVASVLARRLKMNPSRIQGLTERLTDAGLVTKADGNRKNPPNLPEAEIATMVLAALADRGLGRVVESVDEFAALTSPSGQRFGDALAATLRGDLDVSTGSVVIRLDPASVALTAGGVHERFGPEPGDAATKTVALPGRVLAAVALELQGRSPAEADTIIALAGAHRAAAAVLAG